MQEIEFRGKNKHTQQWVYGDLLHKGGKSYIGYWVEDDDSPSGDGYIECEVIPETIGQYIGIKDIHGKKVFRGDIVKVKETIYADCSREEIEEIKEYTGEVVWHLYGWFIAIKKEKGIIYNSLWLWNIEDNNDGTMEILGNRWDNLEMRVIA